jgi:hypothetical protein
MRATARVALISMAVPASFGLAGCAAIDELKETFMRWVESEKLPSGPRVFAEQLPEATTVVPPEKTPKEEPSKPAKKKDKSGRKPQRPQTVAHPPSRLPTPDTNQATRSEGTEGQSAPAPPPPRWLSRWPEAPPPGHFSR